MLLWESDIPSISEENLKIIMSQNDFLIDVDSVHQYLRECGVPRKCVPIASKDAADLLLRCPSVFPGYQHGQPLLANNEGLREIIRNL